MYLKVIAVSLCFMLRASASQDVSTFASMSSEQDDAFPRASISKRNRCSDDEQIPRDNTTESEFKRSRSEHSRSMPPLAKIKYANDVKENRTCFNIAIVGGGGAGTIIAALLSNISAHSDDVGFAITLFERNDCIINGSTFETAAILHAGGREYPNDPQTAACCQMTGELFKRMFPELYAGPAHPIVFAVNSQSSVTAEIQKETHEHAKKLKLSLRSLPTVGLDVDSQSDIPVETIQTIFSTSLAGGVLSRRDRLMNIFERNALLKKYIAGAEDITVKAKTGVSRIIKKKDARFEIIDHGGRKDPTLFDHVILTAWDQTNAILEASCVHEFTAEDRIIALCDISQVAHLQKTPILTLTGGAMFVPLNDAVGIAYRCIEEASYPLKGEKEIHSDNVLLHGQKIVDELKAIFKKNDGSNEPFEHLELLGARRQKIVIRSNTPLEKRHYEPPVVTHEGIIVAVPPKATFIGALALQTLEQLFIKLPDSVSTFKERWGAEITRIVPDNASLYTGLPLPEAFMIRTRGRISQNDIINEKVAYFKSCHLNERGVCLCDGYHVTLREEAIPHPAFLKRSHTVSAYGAQNFSSVLKSPSLSYPVHESCPLSKRACMIF